MSAGRAHRRRLAANRPAVVLAEARRQPLQLVGHQLSPGGALEVWRRGEVLFLVPATAPGMPDELVDAIEARRAATLHGRCPRCGARVHVDRPGRHQSSALVQHEPDCPGAVDVGAAIRAWRQAS